jgi:hypothetical protein
MNEYEIAEQAINELAEQEDVDALHNLRERLNVVLEELGQ